MLYKGFIRYFLFTFSSYPKTATSGFLGRVKRTLSLSKRERFPSTGSGNKPFSSKRGYHLTSITSTYFAISTMLFGQAEKIQFHEAEIIENIDYHSFAPQLMLSHTLEKPFQKMRRNPQLRPSRKQWDSKDVADPFVFVSADSVLLFYDGDNRDRYHIGYAVRDSAGWGWRKRHAIIEGSGGDWDHYHQIAPVVLQNDKGWRLYYNGHFEDEELGYRWGMATSKNGAIWQYPDTRPMMELDTAAWDFAGNVYGDILYFPQEKEYRMWYTGFQGPLAAIGMATSKDGYAWKKTPDQPVLTGIPGVISPDILFNGKSYLMFFVQLQLTPRGIRTQIMRAESDNGISWKDTKEVLKPKAKWEGKRLMRPHLSYFEGRAQLYYCAGRGGSWKIGMAYTYPDFSSSGRWLSRPLTPKSDHVIIKYEQPTGTTLSIFWKAANSPEKFAWALTQEKVLRKGVYESVIPLPEKLRGQPVQIEMLLETGDMNKSPVVYEVFWR